MDFRSFLAPMFAKGLIWAVRQGAGKAKGDAGLASPVGGMLASAATQFAANAAAPALESAAAHGVLSQAHDALAAVIGVATTEQAIAALGPNILPPTLDLSSPIQGALLSFLDKNIVKGTSAKAF